MSAYCLKLLRIDLTAGKASTEPIDLEVAKKFVGGRGLGTYYLTREIDPNVDPLAR